MPRTAVALLSLSLGGALVVSGCVDDGGGGEGVDGTGDTDGLGDDTDGGTDESGDGTDGTDETGETGDDCNPESPYMGGWDIGCCQDEVVQNGWQPGNTPPGTVLPDWTFTDQFGEPVRIYDFCHEAIYFEYVAFW